MTLEGAKNIVQIGFAWAGWTSEQKEAFRTLLLETEKPKQLELENSKMTLIINEYQWLKSEGRLFKLPCKVGDTVYEVHGCDIVEMTVVSFEIDKDGICAYLTEDISYGADAYPLSNFGNGLFLNKADANNALEGYK